MLARSLPPWGILQYRCTVSPFHLLKSADQFADDAQRADNHNADDLFGELDIRRESEKLAHTAGRIGYAASSAGADPKQQERLKMAAKMILAAADVLRQG